MQGPTPDLSFGVAMAIEVDGVETAMLSPVPHGSCNSCHAEGSMPGFVAP